MAHTESVSKKAVSTSRYSLSNLAKVLGPGIIAVLSWLGAGDLITSSVAGSNYGYAMMWVLAVSLLLRFLIVNIIARFQLCNNQGMSILQGYAQLHPLFAYFMFGYALIMAHLTNAYMIKGAGEALSTLLHINQPLVLGGGRAGRVDAGGAKLLCDDRRRHEVATCHHDTGLPDPGDHGYAGYGRHLAWNHRFQHTAR